MRAGPTTQGPRRTAPRRSVQRRAAGDLIQINDQVISAAMMIGRDPISVSPCRDHPVHASAPSMRLLRFQPPKSSRVARQPCRGGARPGNLPRETASRDYHPRVALPVVSDRRRCLPSLRDLFEAEVVSSAHSYKAQTPLCHRTHLRAARRTCRTVVRATHTPSILVLPMPHPTATCVTISFGEASGVGVMPCADVASVRAKPVIAINLSIVLLLWAVGYRSCCCARPRRPIGRPDRFSDVHWQTCIRPSSNLTKVPGVQVMPLRAA